MQQVVVTGALLSLTVVSGVVLVRRPRHPVAVVLAVMTAAALLGAVGPGWLSHTLWALAVLPLSALLVAFPDGPRGRGWRLAFWYLVAAISVVAALAALPEQVSAPIFMVTGVLAASVVPVAAAAVVSLVRLWRRSVGERRWRIGLVLAAGLLLVVPYVVLGPLAAVGAAPWIVAGQSGAVMDALYLGMMFTLVPLAVGVSMLLEPVGRRWVWVERMWPWLLGAGGALLVGGTVFEVALALGTAPGDPAVVAAASLAVAGCVGGAGALLRRASSRLPVPEDRATVALRDLADRLDSVTEVDAVPALVASTVRQVLDLRGAAVDLRVDGRDEQLAHWGELDGPSVVLPLHHAGELVGRLVLVPHRDGVPVDVAPLDPFLPSVAASVAATGLLRRLAAAHQRAGEVRDGERARLRGDLHDELSPSLAGVRLTLHAARAQLPRPVPVEEGSVDPPDGPGTGVRQPTAGADVDSLLARADAELGRAGGVVRGILEDLRPDTLDTDGLLATVRARAAEFDRPGLFAVTVESASVLPRLSPPVEVAVLRVASEAVCNAARHSGGTACRVSLKAGGGGLALEVADNGTGIPAGRPPGIGLRSMAMRAGAAGGSLAVDAASQGGTTVAAWFPADLGGAPAPGAQWAIP